MIRSYQKVFLSDTLDTCGVSLYSKADFNRFMELNSHLCLKFEEIPDSLGQAILAAMAAIDRKLSMLGCPWSGRYDNLNKSLLRANSEQAVCELMIAAGF